MDLTSQKNENSWGKGGYPCSLLCSHRQHHDSLRAKLGRLQLTPSWFGEGWHGHPVRLPNLASSLRHALLPALSKPFTRDNPFNSKAFSGQFPMPQAAPAER